MTVYYTKKGDDGTSVIGRARLEKDDALFELLGDIDELNGAIAVSLLYIDENSLRDDLLLIQDNLFSLSAIISGINSGRARKPEVGFLEKRIEKLGDNLPELNKFVIPGGSNASAYLHLSRSIARRVERRLVSFNKKRQVGNDLLKYINRLSSFLFVAALYMNYMNRIKEKNPKYI